MKKKILSLILVIMMVFATSIPAFAESEPDITAMYDKGDKTVSITVDGVTEAFTGITNNTTKTYTVNGWEINVSAKNDVATINSMKQIKLEDDEDTNDQAILDDDDSITDPVELDSDLLVAPSDDDDATIPDGVLTYLKGSSNGSDSFVGWKNAFWAGDESDYNGTITPEVWHLVTPNDTQTVSYMQLTFTNGEVFVWTPDMGYSVNSSGNNPGWIVYAPAGWDIAHNQGNPSGSFLVSDTGVASNFNISGYGKGTHVYAQILKIWRDKDGNVVDKPAGIDAIFDIYEYAEGATGEPVHGTLVKEEVRPNEKIDVAPGKYIVAERTKAGYVEQPDQVITVGAGTTASCTFENEPEEFNIYASFSFEKKVADTNIAEWLTSKGYDNISGILEGIKFYLKGTGGNSHNYGPESPGSTGMVSFSNISPGTYTLYEEITGAAVGIFKKMADIEVTLAGGDDNYFVLGGTIKGIIEGAGIEEGDLFTIVNGYGDYNGGILNYPGLNNNGDLFYIGVTNVRTGYEFASFCANAGSVSFGGPYMVSHSINERKWLQAFNYIVDNYGGKDALTYKGVPNSTRKIAQTVVWALLGAIDLDSEAWGNVTLSAYEKAAVEDTMANYDGYVGYGNVVDVVYMTGQNSDGTINYDFLNCQPQIVPIFGMFYVENELDTAQSGLTVTANATEYYNEVIKQEHWARDWWNLYGKDTWNLYGKDTWNLYGKDTWNFYGKDTWNIYGKDWWNIYGKDTWNIYGKDTWDTFGKDMWNIYGKDTWDTYSKDTWNIYGKDTWNTYGKDTWNIYGKDTWNTYGKDTWNVYGKDTWNVYGKDTWNTYGKDTWNVYGKDTWNIYGKDTWNIYGKDYWDIYGKDTWNVYSKDAWNVLQREVQPYQRPMFEKKTSSVNGTLVSGITYGYGADGKSALPQAGGYLGNGMTFLKINNITQYTADNPLTVFLADSSPNSNGKKGPSEYNKNIGFAYNLYCNNGKIYIGFGDRYISASFGIVVSDKAFSGNPTSDVKHDNNPNGTAIKADKDGNTFVFLHASGAKWFTTGKYEFVGWRNVPADTVYGPYNVVGTDEEKAFRLTGTDVDKNYSLRGSDVDADYNLIDKEVSGWLLRDTGVDADYNLTGTGVDPDYNLTGTGVDADWNLTGTGVDPDYNLTGTGVDPDWNLTGTGVDPDWNLTGTDVDTDWNLTGTGVDPDWNLTGTDVDKDWNLIGTDVSDWLQRGTDQSDWIKRDSKISDWLLRGTDVSGWLPRFTEVSEWLLRFSDVSGWLLRGTDTSDWLLRGTDVDTDWNLTGTGVDEDYNLTGTGVDSDWNLIGTDESEDYILRSAEVSKDYILRGTDVSDWLLRGTGEDEDFNKTGTDVSGWLLRGTDTSGWLERSTGVDADYNLIDTGVDADYNLTGTDTSDWLLRDTDTSGWLERGTDQDASYTKIEDVTIASQVKTRAYVGPLTLVVTKEGDTTPIYDGLIANGGTWSSDDVSAGTYICVLKAGDLVLDTKSAVVEVGENASVALSGNVEGTDTIYWQTPSIYNDNYNEDKNVYNDTPVYNADKNVYNNTPVYNAAKNVYNDTPVYNADKNVINDTPVYNKDKDVYNDEPVYNADKNVYNEPPVYNEDKDVYIDEPVYNAAKNVYDETPVYNEDKDVYNDEPVYNADKNVYNEVPVYNADKNEYDETPVYNAAKNVYNDTPVYNAAKNVYDDVPVYNAEKNVYNDEPVYNKDKDVYNDEPVYNESKNVYIDEPVYNENKDVYITVPVHNADKDVYISEPEYNESKNVYNDVPVYNEDKDVYNDDPVYNKDKDVYNNVPVHNADKDVYKDDPVHNSAKNVYNNVPVYNEDKNVYDNVPVYNSAKNVYNDDPVYNKDKDVYNNVPVYNAEKNVYNETPVYNEDKNVYDNDPVYNSAKNVYNEIPVYNEDKNVFNETPVYNEDKDVYNETPVYNADKNIYNETPVHNADKDVYIVIPVYNAAKDVYLTVYNAVKNVTLPDKVLPIKPLCEDCVGCDADHEHAIKLN